MVRRTAIKDERRGRRSQRYRHITAEIKKRSKATIRRMKYGIGLCLLLFIWTGFLSAANATSLGDPFEGGTLQNPNWKWQAEPPTWNITDSVFMDCQTNRNLWYYDQTHCLYQEIDTIDIDVETEFHAEWNSEQGRTAAVMGIVVKSPKDDQWVTLQFWARAVSDIKGFVKLQSKGKESIPILPIPRHNPVLFQGLPAGTQEVDLQFRLKKVGDTYTAFYKGENAQHWRSVGSPLTLKLTPPLRVGIYGGVQSGYGKMHVAYKYFKDNLNPFRPAAGDLNGDGVVNILDLVIVANAVGTSNSKVDLNGDGVVNILDLVIVANAFQ